MNYTQVLGQAEAKQRLRQMVAENRVPHALLIKGPAGSGTLPLALAFASHLLCTQKSADGPCGQCSACYKTSRLIHPDLHFSIPIVLNSESRTSEVWLENFREALLREPYLDLNDWAAETHTENKVPVIGVDEIKHLLAKLSYTSFEGQYKIVLMWLPEKMNNNAANKILKVLEEPGERTVFIMVSQQPDQLLPTILSRLQQLPLTPLNKPEIEDYLLNQRGVPAFKVAVAAYLADGNLREALALSSPDDEEVYDGEADMKIDLALHFQTFMRLAFNYDYARIWQWVEDTAPLGREQHKRFFLYGLNMFRDCVMYNYGNRDLVKVEEREKQFLQKFAPFVNKDNVEKLMEEFNQGHYHVDRNANPRILFTDLFGRCHALIAPQKRT